MFFIFGISTKENNLDFNQTIICPCCDGYGRLEVIMTYTYFSLFFLPIFKWNKKYYVKSSCCDSLYTIHRELGRTIEKGNKVTINESDLNPISINYNNRPNCMNCGFPVTDEFDYCPKCGTRL